jgi:sugar phosphate isomerase/epimerase
MSAKISRRKFFSGAGAAAAAGGLAVTAPGKLAAAVEAPAARDAGLPDVWGQDFLYQWSPPQNVKRDLTPGASAIRLSCSEDITNREGTDYASLFKGMRDAGWTACEAASAAWLSRKMPDTEVAEIKRQLKANDVVFYGIHCAGNIIAPDPQADQWQRHIIDAVHAAEDMGCQLILTHSGSIYPDRNAPHPLNWSRAGWTRSVNALKNICKSTAGSKIEIAIEPVNTEAINNPWAFKRLREDVGDPRLMCGLDITNMVFTSTAFRMTELLNTTFDLLDGQISYVHAKDFVWDGMLPGLDWAMNGTGNMDYETFLVRVSRIKNAKMYVEFLRSPEEYQEAQRNIRAIADKVGVKIYGTQQPA